MGRSDITHAASARLFFAIAFDPQTKLLLASVQETIRPYVQNGRFPPPDNLHMTLHYLGATPLARLAELHDAMETAWQDSFSLSFSHAGLFPRAGQSVFWLGVAENPALHALQSRLVEALGLPPALFSPHITLARGRPLPECDAAALEAIALDAGFAVRHISLMQSHRPQGTLVYTEIHSYPALD